MSPCYFRNTLSCLSISFPLSLSLSRILFHFLTFLSFSPSLIFLLSQCQSLSLSLSLPLFRILSLSLSLSLPLFSILAFSLLLSPSLYCTFFLSVSLCYFSLRLSFRIGITYIEIHVCKIFNQPKKRLMLNIYISRILFLYAYTYTDLYL